MRFGSLFAGIGGLDLGLERAGMECVWQVEIDNYCTRVLEKHWPDVKRYRNVREVGKHNLESVDLIAGGFPCQPHSVAGKQEGAMDDRNLWPEFIRIIRETRSRYIIAENVPGITISYLETVLSDLEGADYICATFNIPACAFDAPHRRERIFIVAHTNGARLQRWTQTRIPSGDRAWEQEQFSRLVQSELQLCLPASKGGGIHDGISDRMDRLRGLGNAVVPQVAEHIGRIIMKHNKHSIELEGN